MSNRRATSDSSSSSTSAAWGPVAVTTSLVPHTASSVISAMMDLPLTTLPSFSTSTSALKRAALSATLLENYVRDGVWTLTRENFTGLLKLRYMSLPAAIRALGFADAAEAVAYYASVQRGIYAA